MGILEKLQSFDVFKNTSREFLESLALSSREEKIAPNTTLLTEGIQSDRFMILTKGEAEVFVAGELVADLRIPGDLMGEISFLANQPASATIKSKGEVEVIRIERNDLMKLAQISHEFAYQLHKILSLVLAKKVMVTNEKARKFEIANRELVDVNKNLDAKVKARTAELEQSNQALETKNFEIVASHRKLEELYTTKEVTFKKLIDLQDSLIPLLSSLNTLVAKSEGTARDYIDQVVMQLENSIHDLRPLSELYSSEQAIKSRRVLVIEPDKKQQVLAKMALGGTGVSLFLASTPEDSIQAIKDSKPDLIFLSSDMSHLIPEIKRLRPAAKLVLMASTRVTQELPHFKSHANSLSNIVSRNAEDRTFTVKNIATTVTKLMTQDIFGVEKYMIWGVDVQKLAVEHSDHRNELIEKMSEHFKNLGVRGAVTDRIGTVTEELLMNAIYDAPVDAAGVSPYAGLPRTQPVQLKESEFAELSFACDGMLAAVSVSDRFGRFRMETLINYLERNYSPAGLEIQEQGKGGAGRGLHQIVENSDLVVFNVKKNSRTEVIAFFNLDPRAKDIEPSPSFHFFAAD